MVAEYEACILGLDLRCARLLGQRLSRSYGMEVVLPIEVQIPSWRVLMDEKLEEAEWIRTRYEELSLIEEAGSYLSWAVVPSERNVLVAEKCDFMRIMWETWC